MSNDVRIAVTGNTADAEAALRRLRAEASNTQGLDKLRGALLSLGPAVVPVAASLVPLAAQAGAAGVATAAFTAAIIPQISAAKSAADAQDKATAAVRQYGAGSKQAEAAQRAAVAALNTLPPATQRASAALVIAKKDFNDWSNALAKDTMPVFTKGLAVATALLPKTSGLVEGASKQFQRLETVLAGDINTPGFDRLNQALTDFADKTLKQTVDGVIHLNRELSEGKADGALAKLMEYAKDNGPQVRETLENVVKALAHIGQAAAQAGPGMLAIVNALAKLVAAIPPDVLTRLVQLYTAFRLIGVASSGIAVAAPRVAALGRSLVAMQAAAAGATGATARFTAAAGTLSTGAKLGLAGAAIAAVAYGLVKLSDANKKAVVSTADLTKGLTSAVAGGGWGAAADAVNKLAEAQKKLTQDKLDGTLFDPSASIRSAGGAEQLGKALGELAKSNLPEATAALQKLKAAGVDIPTKYLKDYNSAQADAAAEAKLTAQSMGIFGAQAVKVSGQLDKQAQAAKGLHDAIFALNDVNRSALDSEIAFQQSLDDTTAVIKTHRNALHYVNGELDLSTPKAREAASALSDLSQKGEDAAAAAKAQGKSQDEVNRILIQTHDRIVSAGQAMGFSKQQAEAFADSLDSIKDPKISVTVQTNAARAAIADATARLNKLAKQRPTPALRADETQLRNVINDANARLNKLNGKTAQTYVVTTYSVVNGKGENMAHEGGGYAKGGPVGAAASGGPRSNLTWVGENGPELVDLAPGSLVHPAANSRTMAAHGGGGGPVTVNFGIQAGAQSQFEQALLWILRKMISAQGGNVQQVLGNG